MSRLTHQSEAGEERINNNAKAKAIVTQLVAVTDVFRSRNARFSQGEIQLRGAVLRLAPRVSKLSPILIFVYVAHPKIVEEQHVAMSQLQHAA
jgi:hypothetical protein